MPPTGNGISEVVVKHQLELDRLLPLAQYKIQRTLFVRKADVKAPAIVALLPFPLIVRRQ